MSRGWGDPGLYSTPLDAIQAGTCAWWTAHTVPHWKCQTLQCSECMDYPVPVEEACEDNESEHISFHVYECKKSTRKDGKEQTQFEMVHMTTKIGEFHRLYHGPAIKKRTISHDELQDCCSLLEGMAGDRAGLHQFPLRLRGEDGSFV